MIYLNSCSLWEPWRDHSLTPCFRENYLNTFSYTFLIGISVCVLSFSLVRSWRQQQQLYEPLNKSTLPRYGAVPEDDSASDSSYSTVTPDEIIINNHPWGAFNCIRLGASVVQLGLVLYLIIETSNQHIDVPIEGDFNDLIRTYYVRIIFWILATVLAVLNIGLSYRDQWRQMANTVCQHLNMLYTADFFLQLVNVYAYYHFHDVSTISDRYQYHIISWCITSLLIVCMINEERYAPSEKIVADTGRVMSGENWTSLYGQFMFTWVNSMMKKGDKATLNDQDLLELPTENRAKFTLHFYRLQKHASMAMNVLASFKWPLIYQFWYCMGWSVLMFGPPFFLNKVIKFIENGLDGDEPVSSAFIYVFGLFLTSCGQSLCFQQALYIGRTLGIRIQSIVIGEVYAKSLRRRDETSGGAEEADKPKVNVNNLLSVDAQKTGEFMAYIFYLYCFPVQIVICIWSLYELLGVASLWGVLVMFLAQPFTFYLSKKSQKVQQLTMACSDARIQLMDELLSAIRIIKFFAWEKQFRQRIMDARDKELKFIKKRLFLYMWIGNAWFVIPILVMVAVFYVYTREFILTASTAFTALALFNNFKTIMDELPFITSFILQAHVSLGRITQFLSEEEVQLPVPNTTSTTRIGFIDNASFSWKKEGQVAQVKDLNLSFPINQFSIICGPTGCGKTTLLSSLLGETYCLSGAAILPRKTSRRHLGGAVSGIAYVAQTAWLQNCSIRDNILFGLPFDQTRYDNVLYMTALTRDLEILEFGDSTEVGEKGITLSGGQKQRIAIARAVYSQAEIVIMDDCLSAVDAHTAKHLHQHCLMGEYMKNRTVILVTHHVNLCINSAAYVVALDDSGSVAAVGNPSDVIASGVLGEEFSATEDIDLNAKEEAAVEGPIPKNNAPKSDGAGKLVKEEKRAEGGVSWKVYRTYYLASGGFWFWFAVFIFFCFAQASTLGQDYWIKVWSSAYTSIEYVVLLYAPLSVQSFVTQMKNGNVIDVTYYLGIYAGIGFLSLGLTTLRLVTLFTGSLKASRRIHTQLLDRILEAKVRFFDTTPVGRIVNRFSSDLESIDQAVAPSLSFLLFSIIATVYVVILVSIITPAFIVPGVFVALMFKSIGVYYLNSSRDMKRLNSVSRSPIYTQFSETVVGVATIRAFGGQERFVQENLKRIDSNNRPFLWMWATNRWLHCRVDVLGAFVSFCTGVVLVSSRRWINPGLAGLSLSYALTFTHHILWVVRMYAVNEMNMNAIERVHEYLDVESEPAYHLPQNTPAPSWPEAGVVKVKDLVMRYAPDTPAVLSNISFETRPREKIGIVGRTGSGKSTLALSLFRFMEPSQGSIHIDGVDIHAIGLGDLRSRLTIIPQDPVLFSGTLRSNLDPFGEHTDADLWTALKRAHLIDQQQQTTEATSAENISLDSPVVSNGNNFSQGQRQLIALARALVKKTSLIVLDEATSSVDFDTDHQIQETIRKEFTESTLLCIAHRIRTVADYDRILVLDQGQIVEFDTPYNLMTQEGGVFQSMCQKSGEFPELLAIAKAKAE